MKEEEILAISKKYGLNQESMKLQIKTDKKRAEEIVKEAVAFIGEVATYER